MQDSIDRYMVKMEQNFGKNIKVGDIRTAISVNGSPFIIPYGEQTVDGYKHFDVPVTDVKCSRYLITPQKVIDDSIGGHVESETVWTSVYDRLLSEFRWDETTDAYSQLTYGAPEEVKHRIDKSIGVVYGERWLCTDTYVGWGIITFNGQPFAIHSQTGRKCDLHIMFTDKTVAESARLFLESFLDRSLLTVETVRMDADITGYFI